MEKVDRLIKRLIVDLRRRHHGAEGLRLFLQEEVAGADGPGLAHLVHGVLQQPSHLLQSPPLGVQGGLFFFQQGEQGFGASAVEIVPDLRQRRAQALQGGDEIIGGQLAGRIVAVAVLPHPLGF